MIINYDEMVRIIAHKLWMDEGCPDGEAVIDGPLGKMKLRDIHWIKAQIIEDWEISCVRVLRATNKIEKNVNLCGIK